MSLREETTKDDPSRVALLYGPVVLAGRLAEVTQPFSDPKKYNDYYTFDYGKHAEVRLKEVKRLSGLHFQSGDIPIAPFYDMQHCRYVVYWKKKALACFINFNSNPHRHRHYTGSDLVYGGAFYTVT